MTNKIEISRDALEWAVEQLEEDGNRGTGYFDTLRALLAAPAAERQEPVEIGYIEHSRDINWECAPVHNRLIWTMPPDQRHTIPQHYKVMLYASPPAPVSVALSYLGPAQRLALARGEPVT